MRALLAVACLAVLNLSGCAARYVLADAELADARADGAMDNLRVYVSNRTITVYDRKEFDQRLIRREIQDRSQRRELKRSLTRNKTGAIIDEDLINGARRLWVSFDRKCSEHGCAYGFVQTEDGRYRLLDLPTRDDYESPRVYRSCVIDRHKMEQGKLRALSDANAVYKLKRKKKKRPKTVFLEVKKSSQKRVKGENQSEPGFD